MLSAAMRLQRPPKAFGADDSETPEPELPPCSRCGCSSLCWCDNCRDFGCTYSSSIEACVDSHETNKSASAWPQECKYCGCSAEFDACGDRLCWCDSCTTTGCVMTNKKSSCDFHVTVNVGLAGETCEMTASSDWSFKDFVRALADETHVASRHLRILHGSSPHILDACSFEEFLATTHGGGKHMEVTAIFCETADEDVTSSSSELSDNVLSYLHPPYDDYDDDGRSRYHSDYDSDEWFDWY
eukprot:TRINITY_DN12600_c0_g2_i1.p1 TRINITY_DN12600_c0_g2~~TRINITY_DN12600_c0_g2_i1.p1  ORF type:complete len:242 (-),score=31.02 TRINITY_DN12600_c0_g2_i1:356-1081(-)